MTVNCHVFQLVPYSDLQVSSANHFCIRKYLLVIVLIIIIFLIILKLIHSGYHAVGSIVEQHHLAAAVKLQKMNCSAIHKTCASLCLCTKVHFLEKKKKKSLLTDGIALEWAVVSSRMPCKQVHTYWGLQVSWWGQTSLTKSGMLLTWDSQAPVVLVCWQDFFCA